MTTDLPAVTVGVDFGTLSGRALVVAVEDGREMGSVVQDYAHAVVDDALPSGRRLPPDWALHGRRHARRQFVPGGLHLSP